MAAVVLMLGRRPCVIEPERQKLTPGARGAAVTSPTPLRTPPPKDGGAAEPGDLSGQPCVFLRTPPKAGGDTMPQSCKYHRATSRQARRGVGFRWLTYVHIS